jgi:hypothetical protein
VEAELVADDLNTVCEFEIALRNVCVWRDRIGEVVALNRDHWPARELALVDSTLHDVERLAAVVAEVRDVLTNVRQLDPNPEGSQVAW